VDIHPSNCRCSTCRTRERRTEGTFPKGRRCGQSDCITILSIYDPGPHCFQHTELEVAELPRLMTDRDYLLEVMEAA
jgi:hypothetical protein